MSSLVLKGGTNLLNARLCRHASSMHVQAERGRQASACAHPHTHTNTYIQIHSRTHAGPLSKSSASRVHELQAQVAALQRAAKARVPPNSLAAVIGALSCRSD
eukprot:1138987-Pelagomonas_calceolata.AAC.4